MLKNRTIIKNRELSGNCMQSLSLSSVKSCCHLREQVFTIYCIIFKVYINIIKK